MHVGPTLKNHSVRPQHQADSTTPFLAVLISWVLCSRIVFGSARQRLCPFPITLATLATFAQLFSKGFRRLVSRPAYRLLASPRSLAVSHPFRQPYPRRYVQARQTLGGKTKAKRQPPLSISHPGKEREKIPAGANRVLSGGRLTALDRPQNRPSRYSKNQAQTAKTPREIPANWRRAVQKASHRFGVETV